MQFLKMEHPLLIPYGGTLRDTAILVGLRNTRAPIGLIAYCGDTSFQARRYVEILNDWLEKSGLPTIDVKNPSHTLRARFLARSPLEEWGWREEECIAAIRLAGLPLPPSPATT